MSWRRTKRRWRRRWRRLRKRRAVVAVLAATLLVVGGVILGWHHWSRGVDESVTESEAAARPVAPDPLPVPRPTVNHVLKLAVVADGMAAEGSASDGSDGSDGSDLAGQLNRMITQRGPVSTTRRSMAGALDADAGVSLPSASDLVVVAVGSDSVGELTPTELDERYADMVQRIRTETPDAALMCLGVWPPSVDTVPYDEAVAHGCRAAGGLFVDLSELATSPSQDATSSTFAEQVTRSVLQHTTFVRPRP